MNYKGMLLLTVGVCAANYSNSFAQGCVAVRGGQAVCVPGLGAEHHTGYFESGDWQASIGYRWLHSDRHFVGDVEQKHRQAEGSEVINDSHFIDLGIQYAITPRYSLGLTIPFVYSDRSSKYEHEGNASPNRYHTSAGGLGDMRLTAYAWLFDPAKQPKGNILVGAGPKFPTGEYAATDTFYTRNGPVIRYVDQSIQPGDGGWGFSAELFAFRQVYDRTSVYLQGFYLFNPETQSSTTTRGGMPFSISDQYLGRTGVLYSIWPEQGLGLSLGGRVEGVPAYDAIGRDEGFRRPGFSVSIEPGLTWMKGHWTAAVTTPVAVYRNRVRSINDVRSGGHGDAAFADWSLTSSIAYRF
jgi:hypothetical protein